MANASLSSSENPHFFQPLLPGFKNNLKIPVKFFSDHIEGKHEGQTVNLISDSSEKTWKVKMEGHRLTEGWKEFVEAHELQISDFVVCRHEGDMLFHVTAFGPSCCEIQYEEESDESESSREEEEENVITESDHSSSDLNSFSQSVTASNLSRDTVTVPMNFARRSCLSEGRHEVVLMNEEGGSWASELKSSSQVKIIRGWTSFCNGNRLEVGDSCTFKLLQNTEKPVFRLYNRTKAERKKEVLSEEDNIVDKSRANRFVNLTLTPNSLELGKQHLPVSFTRVNMLNKPGEIILVDKNGNEWSMGLKAENRSGMYIMGGNGWKKFCSANEVGVGDYLTLELIQGGTTSPLLKFCSQMKQSPSEAEALVNKRARVQRWSQETRPKLEIRENTEDGETSHRPRASTKSIADHGDLLHTQPCSVSDQVVKVKQSVVDTLTSIRRFLAELKTMEEKLGDSLQEINKLEEEVQDNRNKTTSSSDDQV